MKKTVYKGIFSYKTDIGKKRELNEDTVGGLVNTHNEVLLFVCDGMGGHNKGDVASKIIKDMLEKSFTEKGIFLGKMLAMNWLIKTINKINKKIFDIQKENPQYSGMGATLSIAMIYKNNLITLNCGDSRIYSLKKHKLVPLTVDHTQAQYLLKKGEISSEEAEISQTRHVLTNAIGLNPNGSFDIKLEHYFGETLLLCSDGLYNNVSIADIENTMNLNEYISYKVENLINLANHNGGSDNVSCLIWETNND